MGLKCNLHFFSAVPSQPGTPEATTVGKELVILEWMKPESDGGSEIKTYVVEKREMSSTRSEHLPLHLNTHRFLHYKRKKNHLFCYSSDSDGRE